MTSIQKYLDYENVKVNFDKIYDAEQYWNQTIKDSIDNNWNQLLKEHPKMFNGSKFRLDSYDYNPESHILTLNIGLTDYKSFIGTHFNPEIVDELKELGKKTFNDEYRLFSRCLGVTATILTSDNQFIFMKRADNLIEEPSVYCNAGGHPEPSNCKIESHDSPFTEDIIKNELFDSMLREVEEETNIRKEHIKEFHLNGISESTKRFKRPALSFTLILNIPASNVFELYNKHPVDIYESTKMIGVEMDKFKDVDESKYSYAGIRSTNMFLEIYNHLHK